MVSLAMMVVAATLLPGCNSCNKDQLTNKEVSDTIKQDLTLSPEAKNLLYEFPTPFEVTSLLEQAKAGYIFDITNPITNTGKYVTEKTKSLNLGVYSADLAYSATYNQVDNTNKFLGCTSKLADELGIAGVYHPDLVEKIKNLGNNKDSLVALVSTVFLSTNDFLSANNRNQIAIYIAAGAFVEGLYLASSLNVVASDNTQITTIILKQQDNYNKLVAMLELYPNDEAMKSINDEVVKLKPLFMDYGLVENQKLPQANADKVNDLVESVRNTLIQ